MLNDVATVGEPLEMVTRRDARRAIGVLDRRCVVLPDGFSVPFVDRQKARGIWRRNIDVILVDAIRSHHHHEIPCDERRACRHVVREDAVLLDHVELPDRLAIRRIGTDDFTAVADVVKAIPFNHRAGTDTFARPIIHLTAR